MTSEFITYLVSASLISAAIGFMACALMCSRLIQDKEDELYRMIRDLEDELDQHQTKDNER
jgi:hypothetical protein